MYVLLCKFILVTVQINIHSFIHSFKPNIWVKGHFIRELLSGHRHTHLTDYSTQITKLVDNKTTSGKLLQTVARRQVGAPCAVSETFNGTSGRVVEQDIANVTPERHDRVIRVVVRVDRLVRPVGHRRTSYRCHMQPYRQSKPKPKLIGGP